MNCMKQKKLFFAVLLMTAGFATLHAQQYYTAVGVRLGYDNGLTLKQLIAPSSYAEGILSFSPRHFQLTGLYEYQQSIAGAPGLDWFVGLGLHLGGINKHKDRYDSSFLFGADLIGGIEYVFPQAPFNISLDWKPTINFTNDYNDYWFSGFALSLRYTFR